MPDQVSTQRGEWSRMRRLGDGEAPLELIHAHFNELRFAPHSHLRFPLGVIEEGALGFRYRGRREVAARGMVNLANPGEPHTGSAALPRGWTYRMFYLPSDLLTRAARWLSEAPRDLPAFGAGVIVDPQLAGGLAALHRDMMALGAPDMEAEGRLLALLARLICRHADPARPPAGLPADPRALGLARDYLEANFRLPLSLAELSRTAGLSPFHLARGFKAAYGLPPHRYLTQLRIREAKRLLALGEDPAGVALAAGFCDQAHLTRRFKAQTGLTPARYRKMVQESLPDSR